VVLCVSQLIEEEEVEVPVKKEAAQETKDAMETDGQPGDAKMEDANSQPADGAPENGVPADNSTKMETEPAKVGQRTFIYPARYIVALTI
jgi:hypothetical protein